MTKRKIMLITVCFAIFAISLLLSRQFFKSAGKRNMDVPAAGSEQIEDSKDTEEMTELERLRYENECLRAENALLKKVKALVEARDARLKEIGRKPSKN